MQGDGIQIGSVQIGQVQVYVVVRFSPVDDQRRRPSETDRVRGVPAIGFKIKRQIGQAWTQDNENANVEALAAKGYNGLALCPADASAANGLYEELSANGAFVVGYAAPTLLPTTASFCVATDVEQAARLATEALIGYMGSEGRILNVLELIEDPNTILRKRGVEETVAGD